MLLVTQVFLGVCPVLLLVFFVFFHLYETQLTAIIAIALILSCNIGYSIVARRYNVLNSGRRGERQLYKTVKHLSGTNIVFCNLPVRYKRGRSELDMLIISHKGIIIVEAKITPALSRETGNPTNGSSANTIKTARTPLRKWTIL